MADDRPAGSPRRVDDLMALEGDAAEAAVLALRDEMLRVENFPSARYIGSLANALREIRVKASEPTEASAMRQQVYAQLEPFLGRPDAVMTKESHGMMLEWYRHKADPGSALPHPDLPPPLPSGPLWGGSTAGVDHDGFTSAEVIAEYRRMAEAGAVPATALDDAVEDLRVMEKETSDNIEMLMDAYEAEGGEGGARSPDDGTPEGDGGDEVLFARRGEHRNGSSNEPSPAGAPRSPGGDDDLEGGVQMLPEVPANAKSPASQVGMLASEIPDHPPPLPPGQHPTDDGASSPQPTPADGGDDIEEIALDDTDGGAPPPGVVDADDTAGDGVTRHDGGEEDNQSATRSPVADADGAPREAVAAEAPAAEAPKETTEDAKPKEHTEKSGCCVIL